MAVIVSKFKYISQPGEIYDPENNPKDRSQTKPDMAFSIQELITRYTRQQALPQYSAFWESLEDVENFQEEYDMINQMDQFDRMDFVRENQDLIKKLKEKIIRRRENALEELKQRVKDKQKEVDDRTSEPPPPPPPPPPSKKSEKK